MAKYMDSGSLVVRVNINNISIAHTLVDLGADINVMTKETMEKLQLPGLRPTPTILQLADRSTVKSVGMLEDVIVSTDLWEYPVDYMVLQPKDNLGGYPLILGRPWLSTVDAYIACRSGNMTISHGNSTKKLTLYPPAKPSPDLENSPWVEDSDEELVRPLLTLDQASTFKQATEDDFICTYLAHPHIASHPTLEHILGEKFQELYLLI